MSSHCCLLSVHSEEKDSRRPGRVGSTVRVTIQGKRQQPQPDHTGRVMREVTAIRGTPFWGLLPILEY